MPERRGHNRYLHLGTSSILQLFVKMIITSNIKKYYCRYQPIGSVVNIPKYPAVKGGSVAEWLACWTQALKGSGSNRSRDAVG